MSDLESRLKKYLTEGEDGDLQKGGGDSPEAIHEALGTDDFMAEINDFISRLNRNKDIELLGKDDSLEFSETMYDLVLVVENLVKALKRKHFDVKC